MLESQTVKQIKSGSGDLLVKATVAQQGGDISSLPLDETLKYINGGSVVTTPRANFARKSGKFTGSVNTDAVRKLLSLTSAKAVFKAKKEDGSESEDDGGRAIIEVIASSTLTDTSGDMMSEEVLYQIAESCKKRTEWLNHSYEVPEDVFGAIIDARVEDAELVDIYNGELTECKILILTIEVELASPRAAKTYEMIKNGIVTFGSSIGVYVLDGEELDDGRFMVTQIFFIEDSIVGIPANWQSWVQSAKKLADALITTSAAPSLAEAAPVVEAAPAAPKHRGLLHKRLQQLTAIPTTEVAPPVTIPEKKNQLTLTSLRDRLTKLASQTNSTKRPAR